MNLADLIPIVSKAAPTLAAGLAGPSASIIAYILSQITGSRPNDIKDIASKLESSPEYIFKLREAEMNFAAETYKTEVDDRKDARAYATKFMPLIIIISTMIIVGMFGLGYVAFMNQGNLTAFESNLISIIFGVLLANGKEIVKFIFGGSINK